MRKTLTAVLLTLSLPTLAMPEGGMRHGEGHKGGHSQHMLQELNLSKEQRLEMRKLMREQMHSRHEITQRYLSKLPAAEQKAMQDELKAAKDKQQQSMRGLLTPEQLPAFEEHLQKMEARRAEMSEFKAWKADKEAKGN